jgi:hypothetical protein
VMNPRVVGPERRADCSSEPIKADVSQH